MTYDSISETETIRAAHDLARELKPGDIVALEGPLGAGKSVFARAMIRALCGDQKIEVPSPTFTLLQIYDGKDFPLYHYDLYRVKSPDEIHELGWEESLRGGAVIVEWPERLGALLPQRRIDVRIEPVKRQPDARNIKITRHTP